MSLKILQPRVRELSACLLSKGPDISRDVRAHQPRPDRALMIATIAFAGTAFVTSNIIRISRGKSSQASPRQQLALDDSQSAGGSIFRQHGVGKTNRNNLIRSDRGVE